MSNQDFVVGQTYDRRIGDNIEPVTLTRPCNFGGWYGTDRNGNTIRVTERTLLASAAPTDNTDTKEDAEMASNRKTVTAAERRARRGAAKQPEATTATVEAPKPAAKPAAKPATAKQAAKPAAKQTPAKQSAKKTAAKQPVVKQAEAVKQPAPETKPDLTAEQIVTIVTTVVEKKLADFVSDFTTTITDNTPNTVQEDTEMANTTTRRTRKIKPAADKAAGKAKTITLKAMAAKKNSWYFKYVGTSKTPLITGCYVSNEAIDALENSNEPITAEFSHGEGKKHSILFRESGDMIVFNGSLYIMRAPLKGSGISEDTPIKAVVAVKSDDEITISISLA